MSLNKNTQQSKILGTKGIKIFINVKDKKILMKDFKTDKPESLKKETAKRQEEKKRNIKGFLKALPVALALGATTLFGFGAAKDAVDQNQQSQLKAFDAHQEQQQQQQLNLEQIRKSSLTQKLIAYTNGNKDNQTIQIIAENQIIRDTTISIISSEKNNSKISNEDKYLKFKKALEEQDNKVGHVKIKGQEYLLVNS